MCSTRLQSPSVSVYIINDHSLGPITELWHFYLGILFDSKMSFSLHINRIVYFQSNMNVKLC